METLKTSFKKQPCCYYGERTVELDFNKFTDEECKKFIKEYFKAGEKGIVIEGIEILLERASHSVSAYMIGLLAYKKYKEHINPQLERVRIEEFSYIWFLICLFHDYAFALEESPDQYHQILSDDQICSSIKEIPKEYWGFWYDPDLIKEYFFKYREGKEHGTIAGVLLRERLNENLEDVISQNQDQDSNNIIWRNLHWSKGHKEWYDFAASLIIKHNIWFANSEVDSSDQDEEFKIKNKGTLARYKVNDQLRKLIINNSERITFDENPLLFLFCLIDTVEPVKINQKINQNEQKVTNTKILDMVNICFCKKSITIGINQNKGNSDCCKSLHEEIHIKAKHLESWMNVKVSVPDNKQTGILRTKIEW